MFVNLATNKISFADPAKQALYDYVEESIRRGLTDETITSVYMSANEDYTQDDIAFLRFVLRYMDLIDGRAQEPIEKLKDILSDINKRAQELIDNNKEDSPEYTYLRRKEEAVEDEYWRKITADDASQPGENDDDNDSEESEENLQEDSGCDNDNEPATQLQSDDEDQDFEHLLDKFIKEQMGQTDCEIETDDDEDEDEDEDETEDDIEDDNDDSSDDDGYLLLQDPILRTDDDFKNIICGQQCSTIPFFQSDRYFHICIPYRKIGNKISYTVEVKISHSRCHTVLVENIQPEAFSETEGCVYVMFDGDLLIPRRDVTLVDDVTVTITQMFLSYQRNTSEFKILCARSISDFLTVERVAFFPGVPFSSSHQCDTTTSYVGFVAETIKQINVHCIISSNIREAMSLPEYSYRLYDQTGRMVESPSTEYGEDLNEGRALVHCGLGGFCGYFWKKGRYRVELVAFEKYTIASAQITIGDHNLEGEVDTLQMLAMLKSTAVKPQPQEEARMKLNRMIGLTGVKQKIEHLSNMASLRAKRKEQGMPVATPSLHACFVGNPGTGKTTVAEIIGQIYKEVGLLSRGHVVRVERRNLVGRYYDSELRAIEQAIDNAQGGVLFIDEAYNLYVKDDPRDPGRKVLEGLLTALSDESRRDWMLVLAGYPAEIEEMMNCNPGLKSRVNERFFFDDYTVEELMQMADLYCQQNQYLMSNEVRRHLQSVVMRDYGARDKHFGNGRYIINLMEHTVAANMAHRICRLENPTKRQLQTIEVEDIPSIRKVKSQSRGMAGLNRMVGLTNLKRNITQHLNFVKMANMRMQLGMHTDMPPLHMIFTGNPGTGKTTVADFMGEIYASMGLLSRGDIIRVEKSDLVGEHVGETEQKVKSVLNRAKGNILFIDEAYQLCAKDGKKDFGANVIDALLTTLSNDRVDMIVILAGYPADMERMLDMNEGLRSRFPYTFHFEDYSVEELLKIALHRASSNDYVMTPKAERLLQALIKREVLRKRSSFGNARFVTRLLASDILPRMATRLADNVKNPTKRQLKTIIAADIPISQDEADRIMCGGFDDEAIDVALGKLDALVGQTKVKRAIHNFVDMARYLNAQGERFVGRGLLKWNFVGNTGTGKSTVAIILADILRAMNLLDKGNIVEVRGEQIFNVSEYQCDNVLRQAMERSRYGMLFIDGDAPEFRNMGTYRMTNEELRIKLTSLTAESGGVGALVIAECTSPRQTLANSLAMNGIYDFDHTFIFDDYTAEELFEILRRRLSTYRVRFSDEAAEKMRTYIEALCTNRNLSFANARTMKLLARTIYEQVVLRESHDKTSPRRVVLLEDVKSYNWQQSRRLGY